MTLARSALLVATLAVGGCGDAPTLLVIDVRTDLVPGVEVEAVRAEVVDGASSGAFEERAVEADADALRGFRAAELTDLEPGDLTVRVTLLRDGVEVVSRPARVTLERSLAVTLVLTRDCRGVECPAPDGDPVAAACVAGSCGDPRCAEEQPDACEPECASDGDCPAPTATCASARCVGGACLAVANDAACGADEYCEAETGCRTRDGMLCPPFSGAALDLIVMADNTCVLAGDQPLRCWGYNNLHLGEPTYESVGTPRELHPSLRWTTVGLGSGHWCGVDAADGLLRCTGDDWAGQLGDGEGESNTSGLRELSIAPASLGIGEGASCAIDTTGALFCWGNNDEGQAGIDAVDEQVWVPTAVEPGSTWRSVDSYGPHVCGIRTDGSLACWGSNSNYELARDPATLDPSRVPVPIGGDTDWAEVSVGREFVLARKTDGTLFSWGADFAEQLGRDGPNTAVSQVGTNDDWVQIEAGLRHACGLRAGGEMLCWGSNAQGQLGDAITADEVDRPTRIMTHRTWVDVGVGHGHTCGLDDTGRVWCWGSNEELELGTGPGPDRPTARTVCP